MESDENIFPLDLLATESQVYIPTEIWTKIISFVAFDDRCRLECVNRQLSDAVKAIWAQLQLNSLSIASPMVDSAAKLATLLRRCGSQLEEIIIGRHIQLDTEIQSFQLCPNLKSLSFANGKSLKAKSPSRVQSFLKSLPNLKCLQFFREVNANNNCCRNKIVTLSEMVLNLGSFPNIRELHLPVCTDDRSMEIRTLRQIRVLSIMLSPALSTVDIAICQLIQLEQLYIRFDPTQTRCFNFIFVFRLSRSLPNLNSLALWFERDSHTAEFFQVGTINTIIRQFAQLRTLVIVCRNQRLEGNLTGPVPVDLSQHRYRQVPLNIFVADYNLPEVPFHSGFTGYSPQIRIIPMPNGRYGEAIEYLLSYNQNDFNFGDQHCLQMVKMSSHFNGQWDFSYGY